MPSSYGPRRYAFLVGIDQYLSNGSRVLRDGSVLSIGNLQGCLNDVIALEAFLRKRYRLESIDILASPLLSDTSEDATKFRDDPLLWPTYKNIRQKFEDIYMSIEPGDLLFFHFSGFGAFLAPVDGSPLYRKKRRKEPALLTTDFCCGQPAVRGWVLNEWLKKFTDMNVHVTVSIDSCYSGRKRRESGTRYRSPHDWPWRKPVPNLTLDQYVPHKDQDSFDQNILQRRTKGLRGRGHSADLWQWSLDPESFTLMTACLRNEVAAEKSTDGIVHGAFTYELLKYLDQDHLDQGDSFFANESIRNQIWSRIRQRPGIYSREAQLLFFDSKFEHCCTAPILSRIDGNMVVIPVGKAHGICLDTEFAPHPRTSDIVFSVKHVEDFSCQAFIPHQSRNWNLQKQCLVVPLRWSLGEAALRIVVGRKFGAPLQKSLRIALSKWISSPVELVTRDKDQAGKNLLRLRVHQGNVQIRRPQSLVGHADPIRHINIPLNDTRVATKSALFLAHLARFKHLLDLRETKQSEPRPFSETLELLEPADARSRTGSYEYEKRYEYTLINNSEHELYFTMVVLGPEFNIEQLYPTSSTRAVPPYSRNQVRFSTKLPDFPAYMTKASKKQNRRNIIRTLVARSNHLSWDSMQLPRIWDACQAKFTVKRTQNSFAESKDASGEWWISDKEISTGPDRRNHPWSSILSIPKRYLEADYPDDEQINIKNGVIRNLKALADTVEADSASGYVAIERQAFRAVSKTLSHHIDKLDTHNQFSDVGWKLPEFIDLEERIDLDTHYLSFAVQWELPEFIASELNGNWDIKSVLTINGTIHEPYAETCIEYVKLFWPTIRFEALESMLRDVHNLFENTGQFHFL